jgi:phospholipase C
MSDFSRRLILQLLGASALAACGGEDEAGLAEEGGAGAGGRLGLGGAGSGTATGGRAGSGAGADAAGAGAGAGAGAAGESGAAGAAGESGAAGAAGAAGESGAAGAAGAAGESGAGGAPAVGGDALLDEIDTFVVLMMENRSFDHYFGALQRDLGYLHADTITGTKGTESNNDANKKKVTIYKATSFTLDDPPHSYDAAHAQYHGGKNDGFVTTDKGKHPEQVMSYYDRTQIPFYYWLADNYTICDHWFCSVLGPTSPNRLYVTAGTSAGMKNNDPFEKDHGPITIWDRLAEKKMPGKLYCPAKSTFYSRIFKKKVADKGLNPSRKMDEFFADAKAGKLPHVSYIEPEWAVADDHPVRDIRLGQAFVASVYAALVKSPQWNKCLFIVIYDENGGFYDHVAPPAAPDADKDFQHLGFRIPALVIGPTVKRGYVSKTVYDHTSVLATLRKRFGLPSFGKRTDAAHVLQDVFDPTFFQNPQPGPVIPKGVQPKITPDAFDSVGLSSHPEYEAALANDEIPREWVDPRELDERLEVWLGEGERLGALTRQR